MRHAHVTLSTGLPHQAPFALILRAAAVPAIAGKCLMQHHERMSCRYVHSQPPGVLPCRGMSQVRLISDQTPLNEVFKIFKASYSHLMIAIQFRDPETGEPLSQVCPPQCMLSRFLSPAVPVLSLRCHQSSPSVLPVVLPWTPFTAA